jgi:hypothetical protein
MPPKIHFLPYSMFLKKWDEIKGLISEGYIIYLVEKGQRVMQIVPPEIELYVPSHLLTGQTQPTPHPVSNHVPQSSSGRETGRQKFNRMLAEDAQRPGFNLAASQQKHAHLLEDGS